MTGEKEVQIDPSWKAHLKDEFEKPYFKELASFVRDRYSHAIVYPEPKNIFRAFDLCPFDMVEVVILGQDPYHGPQQANGLCFAVSGGMSLPPSLQNIFKEIESDLGKPIVHHGGCAGIMPKRRARTSIARCTSSSNPRTRRRTPRRTAFSAASISAKPMSISSPTARGRSTGSNA
jgi:hypothetical protein